MESGFVLLSMTVAEPRHPPSLATATTAGGSQYDAANAVGSEPPQPMKHAAVVAAGSTVGATSAKPRPGPGLSASESTSDVVVESPDTQPAGLAGALARLRAWALPTLSTRTADTFPNSNH